MTTTAAYFKTPDWRVMAWGKPETVRGTVKCPRLPRGIDPQDVAEILVAARSEIMRPERWTQGCLARVSGYANPRDQYDLTIMPAYAIEAFCAWGAVVWVGFWKRATPELLDACEDVLRAAMVKGRRPVETWNDMPWRQHHEVVELFGRAILLVTRGEA